MHSIHIQPVRFSEDNRGVTALTRPPLPTDRFAAVSVPLVKRGVGFTIDFETGEHIEARLPDSSFLLAGPTFDDIDEDLETTGPQNGWVMGWLDPLSGKVDVEVLYDSRPGGLDQQHRTDVAPMHAALDGHLDRRGVPAEQDVQDRRNRAESLLHRAGFVAVTTDQQTHHRLASSMTDPAERRAAVTRAIDYLQAEGFAYDCQAGLVSQTAASAAHTPDRPWPNRRCGPPASRPPPTPASAPPWPPLLPPCPPAPGSRRSHRLRPGRRAPVVPACATDVNRRNPADADAPARRQRPPGQCACLMTTPPITKEQNSDGCEEGLADRPPVRTRIGKGSW
ncbi:hypothetical protein [Kitasatospora sp. NPDC089509]|uniref:hypothetical protein n=1 Tax=Kitasatospora sp. NPDC089509 TaxID=3364079 RepID=UPI0037F51B4D